jgi:cell division protein FtsL
MATAFAFNEVPGGEDRHQEPRVIRGQGKATQQLRPDPRIAARRLRPVSFRKPVMVEFHTLKQIDNSRLVRRVEPVKLRAFYRSTALGGIIAVFFMLYIYQHFRCIDLSFQLEDLRSKQAQAQQLNGQLKLEIANWRSPHRIDVIAHQLGLKRPDPAQVLEYSNFDANPGGEVEAARLTGTNHNP